jgi:tetratricopeptide (TPR) repeat protein
MSETAAAHSSLLNAINAALAVDDSVAALRLCKDRLAVAPDNPDAHRYLGQIYAPPGDQAAALFRHSLTGNPDDLDAWFGLGHTKQDMGRAEFAPTCSLNVLTRQPGHGLALGQYLTLVKNETEAASRVTHAQQALARRETPDEAKALVGYGLAKYYDRRGQCAQAARAGLTANATRRRKAGPLNRAALQARVDGIIATYTGGFFAERRQFGMGTDQPVFIVGLPRSGTTLIEQILSAHPLMHGAGELPDLARLAVQSTADRKDPPLAGRVSPDR